MVVPAPVSEVMEASPPRSLARAIMFMSPLPVSPLDLLVLVKPTPSSVTLKRSRCWSAVMSIVTDLAWAYLAVFARASRNVATS